MTGDFLDEMIAERAAVNPAFRAMVEVAIRRRQVDAQRVAESMPEPK